VAATVCPRAGLTGVHPGRSKDGRRSHEEGERPARLSRQRLAQVGTKQDVPVLSGLAPRSRWRGAFPRSPRPSGLLAAVVRNHGRDLQVEVMAPARPCAVVGDGLQRVDREAVGLAMEQHQPPARGDPRSGERVALLIFATSS